MAGCGEGGAPSFRPAADAQQAAKQRVRFVEPGQRQPAPKVAGTTLDGERVALSDHEGEVVVLNFWASWCPPCRDEMPALKEIHQQTRDRGVRFLGVNILDDKANARAFVRTFDIEYPSIYDQPGQAALAFRGTIPTSPPNTIVIDRDGRVAARIIGETDRRQLQPIVTRVADEG